MEKKYLEGFRAGWRAAADVALQFHDATANWSDEEYAKWLQRLEVRAISTVRGDEPYSKYITGWDVDDLPEDGFKYLEHDVEEAEYERSY